MESVSPDSLDGANLRTLLTAATYIRSLGSWQTDGPLWPLGSLELKRNRQSEGTERGGAVAAISFQSSSHTQPPTGTTGRSFSQISFNHEC